MRCQQRKRRSCPRRSHQVPEPDLAPPAHALELIPERLRRTSIAVGRRPGLSGAVHAPPHAASRLRTSGTERPSSAGELSTWPNAESGEPLLERRVEALRLVRRAPAGVDWRGSREPIEGIIRMTVISNTEMRLNASRHGGRGMGPSRSQVRLPRLGFRPAPRPRTLDSRTRAHPRPCAYPWTWSHRLGAISSPAPSLWSPPWEPWSHRKLARTRSASGSRKARRSPTSARRASTTNHHRRPGGGVAAWWAFREEPSRRGKR